MMGVGPVDTASENRNPPRLKLGVAVAKSAGLLGASGGAVLRIEIEDHFAAAVIAEAYGDGGVADYRRRGEVRGGIADFEHRGARQPRKKERDKSTHREYNQRPGEAPHRYRSDVIEPGAVA